MATVGRLCDLALKSRALTFPMVQAVRYRKPRWLPIAKSKEFYVREPTPIDPDEYSELKLRYSHYRTAVRSIRQYLKKELFQSKQKETALHGKGESADFALMELETNHWNQQMAALRENRQMEEQNAENSRLHHLMSQREQKKLEEVMEAERRLHEMKDVSKDLITGENLDQEIEKMLDSRSDYNYALTRDGQILKGEDPKEGNAKQTS